MTLGKDLTVRTSQGFRSESRPLTSLSLLVCGSVWMDGSVVHSRL